MKPNLAASFRKAVAQFLAAHADIFEELFFFDDLEELEGSGTNQRAAAKRGAVHPRRDARSNVLLGENGAERKASGERLGDQNNVRLRGKFLIGEEAAGAAEPALNFIGDQESAVLGGKRASTIPEYFADGIDSPFALDCFKKDGAYGVVEFRLEISDVVETHELRTGNKGRERQAVLFRGGDADGAERAAMKRILKRKKRCFFAVVPAASFGWRPKRRASLSAPSIASVPLLAKNTRSSPDHPASLRASGP